MMSDNFKKYLAYTIIGIVVFLFGATLILGTILWIVDSITRHSYESIIAMCVMFAAAAFIYGVYWAVEELNRQKL